MELARFGAARLEHRERLARRAARAEHKRAAHEAQPAEAGVSATDAAADVVPGARTQRRTASSRAERKGKK